MATTKCILPKWKINKDKTCTVYLRITKNRKTQYIGLGVSVDSTKWDEKRGFVLPGHPNSPRINAYLTKKSLEAQKAILGEEVATNSPEVISLKNAVKGLSGVEFFPYAKKFIKIYQSKGKIGTYNRFNTVINKMEEFAKNPKFTFDNLTVQFLKDYEYELRNEKENANNTIFANFKAIMRIVNEAERENLISHDKNPFNVYKIRWQNTEKVFLNEEELFAIENLKLVSGSMKYHHRNIYVFACYAGGIRISDIITLRWDNFTGTHILLKTQKTGSVVSIMLPQKALEILELYKPQKIKKSDFIFPFIDNTEKLDDPVRVHTLISRITAYTNNDLADLAKDAEIEKHLHFHTSRHTWATRALKKGMRIEYVSKLMGHNSIRTTQVYAKIVNADLDGAMRDFDQKVVIESAELKAKKEKEDAENKNKPVEVVTPVSEQKKPSKKTSKKV